MRLASNLKEFNQGFFWRVWIYWFYLGYGYWFPGIYGGLFSFMVPFVDSFLLLSQLSIDFTTVITYLFFGF